LRNAGFKVVLGIDRDPFAVETHRSHFGGASVSADISDENVLDELLEPLRGKRIDLLAGGPPCQPFSKPARWIRSSFVSGNGSLRDHRRELWRSFLYAAEALQPRAILIENVPDIATNEDGIILRSIFARMEALGYSVDCRAYFARELGVAQHRQRVFVVGFKNGARLLDWPAPLLKPKQQTLRNAISDLPRLEGGWDEPTPPYAGPITELQKALRESLPNDLLFDHVTRAVRKDDLVAFGMMTDKTRYDELPEQLRRYGATSFTDKYNRLAWDEPCRTIAAHMSKDGYWYIHPDQHRTLSVREAARVQSFPDWFRFAGHRTAPFKQIGEAVPPLVGEAIGRKILDFLGPSRGRGRPSSRLVDTHLKIRGALGKWFDREAKRNSQYPWRLEPNIWLNLTGELLFGERGQRGKAKLFWPNFRKDWPDPRTYLRDTHSISHLRTIGMGKIAPTLHSLARYLVRSENPVVRELTQTGVTEKTVRRAMALSGTSRERPNDTALIRVASRVFERMISQKSNVENQIATALLVGEDEDAVLYAAAIELGEAICTAAAPACMLCPIERYCSHMHRD
jgi:DNA (cytosine-5)-methyltransferase 1